MKRYGVDSWHSWFLTFACTVVFFTTGGSYMGTVGILYVKLMEEQKLSTEEASWPSSINSGMALFAGIATVLLSKRLSLRCIITFGVAMSVIGYCSCAFSTNYYFICIFNGAVTGFGVFLSNIPIPVLITRVFKKHRATAMGIILTSVPAGSLIYPVIVQFFLESYGLRGTFLMIGGVNLHGILGAIVLVESSEELNEEETTTIIVNETFQGRKSRTHDYSEEDSHRDNNNERECLTDSSRRRTKLYNGAPVVANKLIINTKYQALSRMLETIRKPGFHFSNFTQCVSYLFTFLIFLVIIDYGVKKGISYDRSLCLLPICSAGQIFGRFCLGCIFDKTAIPRTVYLCLLFTVLASSCFALPFCRHYEELIFVTIIYGIVMGNLVPVANILFADYLPQSEILLAMAISRSFLGVLFIFRSFLIGIFCEDNGSYDHLFYFMGGLSGFSALVMLTEKLWVKESARN